MSWREQPQYNCDDSPDRVNYRPHPTAPQADTSYQPHSQPSHYDGHGYAEPDYRHNGYGWTGGRDRVPDSRYEEEAGRQYTRGAFQRSQEFGQQRTPRYAGTYQEQSLYPAPSADYGYYAQRQEIHDYDYGQHRQYAQSGYAPSAYRQPYEQSYDYRQESDELASVAPNFNANASIFTPRNEPQRAVQTLQPMQSVYEAGLWTGPYINETSSQRQHHGSQGSDPMQLDSASSSPSLAPQTAQEESPPPPPPPPAPPSGLGPAFYAATGDLELGKRIWKIEQKTARKRGKNGQVEPQVRHLASDGRSPSTVANAGVYVLPSSDPNSANLAQGPVIRPPSPLFKLLKRPEPTSSYLKQAEQTPGARPNEESRPLLVILDLNGTLLHRKNRKTSFTARPHVSEFLWYLMENHKVMIWSSARPENVQSIVKEIFTPKQLAKLIAVWGRERLQLTPEQYNMRVQVYKQLSWVWRDDEIANSGMDVDDGDGWAQDNTVLIDDSVEKAASEPYNLIKIDEFEGKPEQLETDVLGQVVDYLEVLKCARDVSSAIRNAPYYYRDDLPAHDWMPIINDMH
ncbi:hypothetical protein LTR56_027129 [Elasticomyces elasticus]|nr:hypothetical protein LTR56_027129 [Elasticomyces elasticus]KAK3616154.1 hypothetical protein LTR22_027170 [Elasticomyces elasticus]KAK4915341.1 hypothetical protein LTR49_016472 [Elasticomyces elasticus]KAK5734123.1 hypothetical protein LTS12_026778 [Elasticomyces elasticus]